MSKSTAVDCNLHLIRLDMKAKGINRKQLGELTDVSVEHISAVLRCKKPMTRRMLNKIADALGYTSDKYMEGMTELYVDFMKSKFIEAINSDAKIEVGTREFDQLIERMVQFGVLKPNTDADSEDTGEITQEDLETYERVKAQLASETMLP